MMAGGNPLMRVQREPSGELEEERKGSMPRPACVQGI